MPEVLVLDSFMHYEESGAGPEFVFLHGNPSSSRLWRQVIPGAGRGLKLAPDLIGMGQSGKPDILTYSPITLATWTSGSMRSGLTG